MRTEAHQGKGHTQGAKSRGILVPKSAEYLDATVDSGQLEQGTELWALVVLG
jgi:hypothetical protein